jgi:ParB family transcriptional regulator, chromosome partitioning protein
VPVLYWYRTWLYARNQLIAFVWCRPLRHITAIFAVGAVQHVCDRNSCVAAASSRAPDKAHCSEETTVAIPPESPDSVTLDVPPVPVQGLPVPAEAIQVDLHRLGLEFAATRIVNVRAVRQLADSIRECGQLVPCIAAGCPEGGPLVLIDGYRRVSALRRVGSDTALVQCWSCSVGQSLTQLLAQSRSRQFDPIEEALLLRELIDAHGLSQREAALECARDVSLVQRRLVLLNALPQEAMQAVRNAQVSSWAAARILAPLARANSEHAVQLLHSLDDCPLSTRELQAWFGHYQSAQQQQRERMVAYPRLLIDSLHERVSERSARQLREGPEHEVIGELRRLQAMLRCVCRHLAQLNTPLEPALKGACQLVHASLPKVSNELSRLMP